MAPAAEALQDAAAQEAAQARFSRRLTKLQSESRGEAAEREPSPAGQVSLLLPHLSSGSSAEEEDSGTPEANARQD